MDGAAANGILVDADGINIDEVTIDNVTMRNNGTGVNIHAYNSGTVNTALVSRLTALDSTSSSGLTFTADAGGTIDTARALNITSNGNTHYGINFFAGTTLLGAGDINNIEVDGLSASGNDYAGLFFRTRAAGSRIENAVARNITSNNNVTTNGRGIFIETGVGTEVGSIELENTTTNGNISEGIRINHLGVGAVIDSISIRNAVATGNSGANGHGVYASSTAGAVLNNLELYGVAATSNNRQGIYLQATGTASLTASIEESLTGNNNEHGIAIYDDTTGTFEVDLGGGGRSTGNNILAGNALEDLAVDYDGRTLFAQNNWWGQSTGIYQSAPSGGLKPQIYYGAPINNGLVGHWTFDNEWVNGTTAYDRSGNGYDATLNGGVSAAALTGGTKRESLNFDGIDDYAVVTGLDLSGTAAVTALISRYKSDFSPLTMDIEFSPDFNGSTTGFHLGINDTTACAGKIASGIRGNAGYNVECYQRPTANAWHNYATVLNKSQPAASENTLYIDGVPATFINQTHAANNTNNFGVNNLYMMSRGGVSFYEAEMLDEVRIYNRALSAAEISELDRMDTTSVIDTSNHRTTAP